MAQYAIDPGFVNPTDQADFERTVDYGRSLRPGSEAGYEVMGDTFRTCVTRVVGGEPVAWVIYDGRSGLSEGGPASRPTRSAPRQRRSGSGHPHGRAPLISIRT